MPEGDTVWRTAQRLAAALSGRRLVLADIRWGTVGEEPIRGRLVQEVLPRGKHLLHRIDGGWTLHTHLRMEGSWRVEERDSPAAARGLRRPDLRIALGTTEWTTLGVRLGMLDLVPREQEHTLVGHLGPDVLGADWDVEVAAANLAAHPHEGIAAALLEQRNLAGVGTFWASEALFAQRVHPWRPVEDLSPGDLRTLLERVHALMDRGRRRAVQSSTGDLRRDRRSWVHGRSGRPCRRCGQVVRVAQLGRSAEDRVFFSCPGCQGGLAPTDDGRDRAPLGHTDGPRTR